MVYSTNENGIMNRTQEKIKLDEEKIKRAIKFKKKEPVNAIVEEEATATVVQQTLQLNCISKVNGFAVTRLG